jgi:hypothetical protein
MYSLGPVGAAEMVAPEYGPEAGAGREAASAGGRFCCGLEGTIPGPACGPTDDCCSPPLYRQLSLELGQQKTYDNPSLACILSISLSKVN